MIRRMAKRALRHLSANDYQPLNRIELSRDHLLHNILCIKSGHPDQEIIPVLKANAYGHGLIQMAEILNDADCAFLAVDGYFEAAQIRDITRHPILVMGYIKPENIKLLDTKKCSFVVQDLAGLEAFGQLDKPVKIHLELNTGMFRLGLTTDEINSYLKVIKRYPRLQLEGVMSHLADADNPADNNFTNQQVVLFDEVVAKILKQGFQPKYIHLAQTAGSTKARSRYANSIRLGLGLYGISPLATTDKHVKELEGLQPVLELKSTIIKTYNLQKGDRVSYNGIFIAPYNMRIATLPLGYYEGVPRELGNKGCITHDNNTLPIVGRVCMNHTMIDITGTDLQTGDQVIVISNNVSQPNSIQAASINYNIFTYAWLATISPTVRRIII